jgi:hypothetical protein
MPDLERKTFFKYRPSRPFKNLGSTPANSEHEGRMLLTRHLTIFPQWWKNVFGVQ